MTNATKNSNSAKIIFFAICSMGISAILTQIVFTRELVSAFTGNELVYGIILCFWFLLTGIGASFFRILKKDLNLIKTVTVSLVLMAVFPTAGIFLLRFLRNIIFIRGAEVSFLAICSSCFVLLLPYCFLTGFMLVTASKLLSAKEKNSGIGQVYFLDNIGDAIGGFLFSFILIFLLNHFQILLIPAVINLFFACLIAHYHKDKGLLILSGLISFVFLGIFTVYDLNSLTIQKQYTGQEIVFNRNSPYGNITVTKTGEQYNFFSNNIPVFTSNNIEKNEENVHYAMLHKPDAENVLLLSGGASGTAKEITKYKNASIDYIETDPLLINAGKTFLSENVKDRKINTVNGDGRLFIKNTEKRYDVVISNIPDPENFHLNRYYTLEFFKEVKAVLKKDGVFMTTAGMFENHIGKEQADIISITYKTLKSVFKNVLTIPGSHKIYMACSDKMLSENIIEKAENSGVKNLFVNKYFLKGIITESRQQNVTAAIKENVKINTDFNPVLYFKHIMFWIKKFEASHNYIFAGLGLLFFITVITMKPVPFCIFSTGFTTSSLQIVFVMVFQIIYGNVYDRIGIITAMFMSGLVAGALMSEKTALFRKRKHLVILESAMGIFSIVIPFFIMPAGTQTALWLIPFMAFISAFISGIIFPVAGRLFGKNITETASKLYFSDYIGAAAGAFLAVSLFIPFSGLQNLCIITGVINLFSAVILLLKRKKT